MEDVSCVFIICLNQAHEHCLWQVHRIGGIPALLKYILNHRPDRKFVPYF